MTPKTKNSIGLEMVRLPAGRFYMGSAGIGENADEAPAHIVDITKPFSIASTEITNKQYELFDPSHKALRGKKGLSKGDDEAVIFVSYDEASAFCRWLSEKEGKAYRLPTEAEWEYACRAGTLSAYSMAAKLPKELGKVQEFNRDPKPVSLQVAEFAPNDWGLYDMHGNVEEWCYDWYGPYEKGEQRDPVGRISGSFRVTRGGSHNTLVQYLRSANRSAMIPADKNWMVGFRVVEGPLPATTPLPAVGKPANMQNVRQAAYHWSAPAKQAFFSEPVYYVKPPSCGNNTPFYSHNHCPAITWCPNGDLLAIWFSTNDESGREMTILASRLRAGSTSWDEPSEFFNVPDRNMTGSSLFCDKEGTLYHMNGVEVAGGWKNLAMVLRTSTDNGASWSEPRLIDPEHQVRNQVIAGMFQTKEGWLIQPSDAGPGHSDGSAIHISKDKGKTWYNPYTGNAKPEFKEGYHGGLIAGIHTGVVQLKNGDLFAFGRNNDIPGKDGELHMPISISKDMGKSWTYSASEFPRIYGGQRLVLRRLNEGPLLLISFTHHPREKEKPGMLFKSSSGKEYTGYGMFAAISYDEGKTWPVKKLLTDGKERFLDGGGWTGIFKMDKTHAEPMGYLAATQTPDNNIHLISSKVYYCFNLQWILQQPDL
ncbi:SUMF1/EgtB/PvdO family nonheme iron enzyme [Pedobacter sp. BS3]|uniref:SUMF1/EgtB/PvdO family nonheme iron enzyme n=1 Tax=Pedobacter sp. BS3 TaxID=2567937 RepID=UPI001F5C0204|nr:SUMF1/EgtB/PvdO family nonheme iron enzyme [Pedobacter sp. BS3]